MVSNDSLSMLLNSNGIMNTYNLVTTLTSGQMNLIHNEKVDVSKRLDIDVIDDKGKNNLTISLMFNWSYGELGIIKLLFC